VDLIVKIIVNATFSFLIWKIIKKLSKNIKKQERAKRDLNKNIKTTSIFSTLCNNRFLSYIHLPNFNKQITR